MTNKTIKSYKAFDKGLKCKDFQYEVGKEYTHEGKIKKCQSGFHACKYPLDVLYYYPLIDANNNITEFAEVEQSGDIEQDNNKICSSKIKIIAKLELSLFIKAAVDFIFEKMGFLDLIKGSKKMPHASTGDWAHNASTGNNSVAIGCNHESKVKGSLGVLVALVYHTKKGEHWIPQKIVTGKIGENGLKANIWYDLDDNGEFCEYCE